MLTRGKHTRLERPHKSAGNVESTVTQDLRYLPDRSPVFGLVSLDRELRAGDRAAPDMSGGLAVNATLSSSWDSTTMCSTPREAANARASSSSADGRLGEVAVTASTLSPSTSEATLRSSVLSTPAEKATTTVPMKRDIRN